MKLINPMEFPMNLECTRDKSDYDNYQYHVTTNQTTQTMKALITLFLTALASAHAISLAETQLQNRDFQPVALNFQAGPASYGMDLVADGQEWFTSALKQPSLKFYRAYFLDSENCEYQI